LKLYDNINESNPKPISCSEFGTTPTCATEIIPLLKKQLYISPVSFAFYFLATKAISEIQPNIA
jgi:hypothetical protein